MCARKRERASKGEREGKSKSESERESERLLYANVVRDCCVRIDYLYSRLSAAVT